MTADSTVRVRNSSSQVVERVTNRPYARIAAPQGSRASYPQVSRVRIIDTVPSGLCG
jgi:hypothetical protein